MTLLALLAMSAAALCVSWPCIDDITQLVVSQQTSTSVAIYFSQLTSTFENNELITEIINSLSCRSLCLLLLLNTTKMFA